METQSEDKDGTAAGLKKQLSPAHVWALAFGCIIGWGAFSLPAAVFLPKAGPLGTAIAFGVGILIMSVIALNYHTMIVRYPKAGGEFTYAQHYFGRRHAFICAWFLGLSYLSIVPLNATGLSLVCRSFWGQFFETGFHYRVAGYDVYLGEILLAAAALIFFAWLSIRGVQLSGRFQTVLAILLVGGVLIVAIAALLSPRATLSNLLPAFSPNGTGGAGILAVVAVAPFCFVGFDTVPQSAEEFHFTPTKTRRIMIIAIIFGGLTYVILNTLTAAVLPEGYASWSDYLQSLPQQTGLAQLPTFYAARLLLGQAGLFFIGGAVLAAILSGIIGFYMAASRLLFSMAREQMLPAWFGQLHPRFHTPHHALLFIMTLSLLAPFFGRTVLGWIVDMSSLGAAIGYGYTSAAALRQAKKQGNRCIVLSGGIGVLLSLCFAAVLLVPLPGLSISLAKEPYVCLVVWSAAGILFYRIAQK
ncbi:MAG: APC family permease [Treponema sp.]|nr:APC family permease [Treponema sp.]